MRHLLETAGADKPTAVIVNEFGDVGIDGEIIEGNSIDTVELNSGCLCCTLKGSLLNAAEELAEDVGAERIIVEASGVADPEDMLDDFEDPSITASFSIAPIVTVVDAAKFNKIRSMLGEFYESQILNADIVIVNKIDLTVKDEIETVDKEIRKINPEALIYFSEQCQVEKDVVLNTPPPKRLVESRHADSREHHHHHAHEDMMSFVIEPNSDISAQDFENYCELLPDLVWRIKGFMVIDSKPVLVQYTVGQIEITDSVPRDHYRLVFIGQDLNIENLSKGIGVPLTTKGE